MAGYRNQRRLHPTADRATAESGVGADERRRAVKRL